MKYKYTQHFSNYIEYLDRIDIDKITLEEEKIIIRNIKNGDDNLRNIFVHKYMQYAFKIAKKYERSYNSFWDIIQEANYGLCYSIDKYDLNSNNRFITYSTYWINAYILDFLDKNSLIKIGKDTTRNIKEVNKIINNLENKLERNITIDDVMDNTELKDFRVKRAIDLKNINTIKNVDYITNIMDNDEDDNFDEIMVEKCLNELSFREKDVIIYYYFDNMILNDISKKMNLSIQTIKLLKNSGIERLRRSIEIYKKNYN